MSVVVVATITPQARAGWTPSGRRSSPRCPKVHAEPGCELYALHEGDGEFVMVERWESAEALAGARPRPRRSPRSAGSSPARSPAPPEVQRLAAVPAGDAGEGRRL